MLQKYFGPPKVLPHVKIKDKISYLGQTISIIHRQMTEQLSFEVDVRNGQKVHFFAQNVLCNAYF